MGIVHKLTVITRGHQTASSATNTQPGNSSRYVSVSPRSSVKLAGAFLFASAVGFVGVNMRAAAVENPAGSTPNQQAGSTAKLQMSPTSGASGNIPPAGDTSTTTNTSGSTGRSSSTTNVTSTTSSSSGSGTTTKVTVNGQSVPVPANGSATIATPGGQTTVTGSTSDESVTHTITSISDNLNTQGDNTE